MFIWCNGRVYKVPTEKHTYIAKADYDAWLTSDQWNRIDNWVLDNVHPDLGQDEFFPFENVEELQISIDSVTVELEDTLSEWESDIENWEIT